MNALHAAAFEPATAESVLVVLQEQHERLACVDEEAEPEVILSFETTVAEWRRICNLADWRRLGRMLNEEWHIAVPAAEWRAVLEPAEVRCLGDVCDVIAQHRCHPRHQSSVDLPEPSGLGGGPSSNSSLNDSWSDFGSVFPTPSMPPCCRSRSDAALAVEARRAPEATSPRRRGRDIVSWGVLAGLTLVLVGVVAQRFAHPWMAFAAAGIFVACYVLHVLAAWCMTPSNGA